MIIKKLLSVLVSCAWIALFVTTTLVATTGRADAQTACPDSSARTDQIRSFAYSNAERNLGGAATCTGAVAIPTNGVRVFSSWNDCKTGKFIFKRENGSGANPTSINCPDCAGKSAATAILAPGSSANVTALFSFPDGAEARYTATLARSVADQNNRYTCSISNAVVAGGVFGGDIVAPTVTLGALTPVGDGTYTSVINLSEAAGNGTAFELGDLVLSNASAVLTGSGTAFTATLTPSSEGAFSVAVAASAFQDAAGNSSLAAAQVDANYVAAPTVDITGLPEQFVGRSSFDITIEFSSAVTGFVAADLSVTNGSVTGLSGSGATYTANLSALGRGNLTVNIPAGVAHDASGQPNIASATFGALNRTVDETSEKIAGFMASRANNLASNQTQLGCLVSSSCAGGSLDAQVTKGQLSFNLETSRERPVWMSMTGVRSKTGASTDAYYLATFGIHHFVSPNTLVGVMSQLDYQSTQNGASSFEGHGWMVGPYIAASLPDQPLVFEARALGGKSDNTIDPSGTYTDNFSTKRVLLQSRLTGELNYVDLNLRPFASLTYTSDTQNAYEDGLGNQIQSNTVSLLQTSLGLDFDMPLAVEGESWILNGGFSALHSSTKSSAATLPSLEDTRGRVHLGLTRNFDGGQFSIGGSYDGIGDQNYEAIGLNVSFNLEF